MGHKILRCAQDDMTDFGRETTLSAQSYQLIEHVKYIRK